MSAAQQRLNEVRSMFLALPRDIASWLRPAMIGGAALACTLILAGMPAAAQSNGQIAQLLEGQLEDVLQSGGDLRSLLDRAGAEVAVPEDIVNAAYLFGETGDEMAQQTLIEFLSVDNADADMRFIRTVALMGELVEDPRGGDLNMRVLALTAVLETFEQVVDTPQVFSLRAHAEMIREFAMTEGWHAVEDVAQLFDFDLLRAGRPDAVAEEEEGGNIVVLEAPVGQFRVVVAARPENGDYPFGITLAFEDREIEFGETPRDVWVEDVFIGSGGAEDGDIEFPAILDQIAVVEGTITIRCPGAPCREQLALIYLEPEDSPTRLGFRGTSLEALLPASRLNSQIAFENDIGSIVAGLLQDITPAAGGSSSDDTVPVITPDIVGLTPDIGVGGDPVPIPVADTEDPFSPF